MRDGQGTPTYGSACGEGRWRTGSAFEDCASVALWPEQASPSSPTYATPWNLGCSNSRNWCSATRELSNTGFTRRKRSTRRSSQPSPLSTPKRFQAVRGGRSWTRRRAGHRRTHRQTLAPTGGNAHAKLRMSSGAETEDINLPPTLEWNLSRQPIERTTRTTSVKPPGGCRRKRVRPTPPETGWHASKGTPRIKGRLDPRPREQAYEAVSRNGCLRRCLSNSRSMMNEAKRCRWPTRSPQPWSTACYRVTPSLKRQSTPRPSAQDALQPSAISGPPANGHDTRS